MILPLFVLLASREASPRERNQACKALLVLLQQRGRSLLGRGLGSSLSDEDLDDVIQFVLTQSSVGTARCQADSEARAWAWCRTVARNFVFQLLRRRKREHLTDDMADFETPGQDEVEVPEQETKGLLDRAIKEATRDDQRTLISIQCAVEYRFQGADIEAQIERWGFPEGLPSTMTALEKKRARDRIYAYRLRGARYLAETLDRLEQEGELTPTDTAFLRAVLAR